MSPIWMAHGAAVAIMVIAGLLLAVIRDARRHRRRQSDARAKTAEAAEAAKSLEQIRVRWEYADGVDSKVTRQRLEAPDLRVSSG
jgi:predicted histidine transporter YuiF (NhaC family)